MDRDEAKNIIQLCRPGNESDLNDPLIAEAFEVLESDSELQIWFEDQQAFDAQMTASMEAIEPPADLKASILAGMRVHRAQAQSTAEPSSDSNSPDSVISHPTRAWWRNPWVGIAALFVFMLVIVNAPRPTDSQLAQNEAQLAQNDPALSGFPPVLPFLFDKINAMNSSSFDKKDESAHELRTYLASTGAPSPKNLCDQLASMRTIGCITFEFNDAQLSMICFKEGEVYHLITADAAAFPDACPKAPQLYEIQDKAFKVWVEGDQLNILTIKGTKADIPEFI
jgi:hypothetical protein